MPRRRNTFAEQASDYARARPRYPDVLYEWIASCSPGRQRAWDCATGNGQAALGLAARFDEVFATDVSSRQISHASALENVRYSVASAETPGFAEDTFDAVVVALALHWFDFDRFWPAVTRVSKPGALFCAVGYDWPELSSPIDRLLIEPLRSMIDPFWTPEHRILWNGYRVEEVKFPYARVEAPPFAIEMTWTFDEIEAYLRTWSAVKRGCDDADVAEAIDRLFDGARASVAPDESVPMRMPLVVLAGRIEASRPD